jgi:hypothetical protein
MPFQRASTIRFGTKSALTVMGFAAVKEKGGFEAPPTHSEAPMADQPPEEIYLKHVRAPDY